MSHTLDLITDLMSDPSSRFRAAWLADNPQPRTEDRSLGFLGWSQDSSLLLDIRNLLATDVYREKASRHLQDGPAAKPKRQLFAPTIADFNTSAFMAVINGGN